MPKKLCIISGHSHIYAAYYAPMRRRLTGSSGFFNQFSPQYQIWSWMPADCFDVSTGKNGARQIKLFSR
jgi:hypothetical protein